VGLSISAGGRGFNPSTKLNASKGALARAQAPFEAPTKRRRIFIRQTPNNPTIESPNDSIPIDHDPLVNEFSRRRHAAPKPSLSARLRRRTAIVARWLHIYLSMVSFAIILFFAVTGFTLNHVDQLSTEPKVLQASGDMPHQWLKPATGDPDKIAIVDHLRQTNHLRGEVSDYRVDDQQIAVSFKGPGYSADAFIDRATNHYDITETSSAMLDVINDLHRGRNTGKAWSIVVDASAILLTLVSLTGLLLIFFVYKKRTAGLVLVALGALVCWIVYAHFIA